MKKGILLLALMLFSLVAFCQIQFYEKNFLGSNSSGNWYKLAEIDANGSTYNTLVLDVEISYVDPGITYKIDGLIKIRKSSNYIFTYWQYSTQGSPGELVKLVRRGDDVLELYGQSINNWGHIATSVHAVVESSGFEIRLITSAVEVADPFAYPNVATRSDWYYPNGALMIGTHESEAGFKLAVKGKIKAEEIKVTTTGWADFVFADDYVLPPLSEVEQHIKQHKHLPAIPSEAEVLENGIELGVMNAKLLQKIEELTLYVIKQEKKMVGQEKKLHERDVLIMELLTRLKAIETKLEE